MNPIVCMGLKELQAALQRKELSSYEVTQAFLGRLEELHTSCHPMAQLWPSAALEQAKESDKRRAQGEVLSPYDGLPLTLKENLDVQGFESTLGVVASRGRPAEQDAALVQLLRQQGCVFLGKSNISQLLLSHECSNPLYGRTSNPYSKDRTPGGSSGGEAAAIASWGSPGGWGTDIGGSIRVPAHFCGIFGFKPTVDRLSNLGVGSALRGQELVRAQIGPMARSMDDLLLLLEMVSPEKCSKLDPKVPPWPIPDPKSVDLSKLRVGFYWDDGLVRPSAALQRAVQRAADMVQEAGATVVRVSPSRVQDIIFTYLAGISADGGRSVDALLQGGPLDPNLTLIRQMAKLPRVFKRTAAWGFSRMHEPLMAKLLGGMGKKSVAQLWRLTAQARALQAEVYAQWEEAGLDAVLCPPHATPALPHGASRDFTLGGALSMRFNFLNFPAGVVPITRVRREETLRPFRAGRLEQRAASIDEGSQGLPVGVQVVARPYREEVALALMRSIEQAAKGRSDYPSFEPDEGSDADRFSTAC